MQSMFGVSYLLDLLFPPTRRAQRVQHLSLPELLSLLKPVAIPDGIALFPYRNPSVRALIAEAKFKENRQAWQLLGDALSDVLPDWISEENGLERRPVALVPIPLSKKRFRERGYNQVTELLRHTHLPETLLMPQVLCRTRNTTAQTKLGRQQRLQNMEGAFLARGVNPAYLYIVVDDVRTTGATLTSATAALRSAGAIEVRALAIAY